MKKSKVIRVDYDFFREIEKLKTKTRKSAREITKEIAKMLRRLREYG